VKPAQQRDRLGYLTRTFGVGIRRACDLIKLNRATYYCKSKAGPQRTVAVLLRREGFKANDKCVYRLYAIEGLSLRGKTSASPASSGSSRATFHALSTKSGAWTSCTIDRRTTGRFDC
jgi:hypothetical protein